MSNDEAKQFYEWVRDPSRVEETRKAFAEAKAFGIENADCTFIVFSETHLAARSLEHRLSRMAKAANYEVGPQAIELVAGWLVGAWWSDTNEPCGVEIV